MHYEALTAARKALQAVKIGGGRVRFSDEYADAMAIAAVRAFLVALSPSTEMGRAGFLASRIEVAGSICRDPGCIVGSVTPNDTCAKVWLAMIDQLRKEFGVDV